MESINWLNFSAGMALALFGWTLYWFGVQVIGTYLGTTLGICVGAFASQIFNLPDDAATYTMGISAALGGILGWMLLRMMQSFFFFLVGFAIGAPLAWNIITGPLAGEPWAAESAAKALAVVVGGLAGGGLMTLGKRYVVALSSAITGATLVSTSIGGLPFAPQYLQIPFAIFSAAVQVGLVRRFIPRSKSDKKDAK